MADMDLGLDMDLDMEGVGEEALEMSEDMAQYDTGSVDHGLAEDLNSFARGFTAAWDLEPPEKYLK